MEYLSINSKDKHKTVSQTLAKLSFQPLRNSRRLRFNETLRYTTKR